MLIINYSGFIVFLFCQGSAGPTGGKGETGSRGQEVCNDNKIKKYKIKFPGTPNTS